MTRIKPGIPEMVVLTSDRVTRDDDGQGRIENDLVVPPQIVEQFRQGYRCMECLAVQSQPFPEYCEEVFKDRPHPEPCKCGMCGCFYPIRAEQPARFARDFAGEGELWPDLEADREREQFQRRTGIVIPRGI